MYEDKGVRESQKSLAMNQDFPESQKLLAKESKRSYEKPINDHNHLKTLTEVY